MARKSSIWTIAGLILLGLGGCQSVPAPPPAPRQQATTLTAAALAERKAMIVAPDALSLGSVYKPVGRCTYGAARTLAGGAPATAFTNISVRPVREKLLISMTEGSRTSTALIGHDGQLFDFNLASDDGSRLTTESFQSNAAAMLKKSGQQGIVVNQMTAIFPHYVPFPWRSGQVVATVRNQSAGEWARYIYKGTTVFAGNQAVVLDLVAAASTGDVLVGFDVVDVKTMLPLLYVFQTQNQIRYNRINCS